MGIFDRLRGAPWPEEEDEDPPPPDDDDEFFEPAELYAVSGRFGQPFVSHRRRVTMRAHPAGDLVLPSGRLTACDPYHAGDSDPFAGELPPGGHPVELRIARFEDSGDERVAAAVIRVAPGEPVSFEEATVPGWPTEPLPPGDFYGYPVDSGIACLTSPEALARFASIDDDLLGRATKPTYVPTWSWANLDLGEGNLIAFSSGFGDGVYPLYWGRDAGGGLVCAMADMQVLDPPAPG